MLKTICQFWLTVSFFIQNMEKEVRGSFSKDEYLWKLEEISPYVELQRQWGEFYCHNPLPECGIICDVAYLYATQTY